MTLFSQVTETIVGGSGWAGAGLLGAVLAWLFFRHLPAKDKQITDVLNSFREELRQERSACDLRVVEVNRKMDGMIDFLRTRAEASVKRNERIVHPK